VALNQQLNDIQGLWNADKQLWSDRFSKQEKAHADEVTLLNNTNFTHVTKLNSDWEVVRVTKDAEIKALYAKLEE
jgi:hypothetical protein